jgi:RNA polymerase sigma-70 factor (ECF subfamily)
VTARWRGTPLRDRVDDAVQDVFLECFREDGALQNAERRAKGFRPFLFGVVRNVSRRMESRWFKEEPNRVGSSFDLQWIADREASLSSVFDQAWARFVLREAATRQRELAADDPRAIQRIELLRLRFSEGLPIREIARRWEIDADRLHKEYAKARQEFRRVLQQVVAEHSPGTPAEVEVECASLIESLS